MCARKEIVIGEGEFVHDLHLDWLLDTGIGELSVCGGHEVWLWWKGNLTASAYSQLTDTLVQVDSS